MLSSGLSDVYNDQISWNLEKINRMVCVVFPDTSRPPQSWPDLWKTRFVEKYIFQVHYQVLKIKLVEEVSASALLYDQATNTEFTMLVHIDPKLHEIMPGRISKSLFRQWFLPSRVWAGGNSLGAIRVRLCSHLELYLDFNSCTLADPVEIFHLKPIVSHCLVARLFHVSIARIL